MIVISLPADLDLSEIYNHTVRTWDSDQAEDYLQFLKERFQALADDPRLGDKIRNHPSTLVYLAKYRKKTMVVRSSHFLQSYRIRN